MARRSREAVRKQAELVRALKRDPGHLPELVILHAQRSLASGAQDWGRTASATPAASARRAGRAARTASRLDGLAAGTPFLIALVPGYVASLWEQARLALRFAAMSGRDPSAMETAAEILVLRGVHPDSATATKAIEEAAAGEREDLGSGVRGHIATLWDLGRRILLFAAFIESSEIERSRLRQILSLIGAGLIWVTTWILPLTFMLLMSWSCEMATRKIDAAARGAWLPDLATPERESLAQRLRRTVALIVVTGIPVFTLFRGVRDSSIVEPAVAGFAGLMLALLLSGLISKRT
ncbi:MAG: hypothetical protein NTX07_03345 [Solirubrobacterales bacterium]|nr:hypothetical protein [Solirubrobacterales bacterium]